MELLTDLWHFALFDKYTCKCKNLSVRRFKLHMNWNPPLNPTLYYTPYKEKKQQQCKFSSNFNHKNNHINVQVKYHKTS